MSAPRLLLVVPFNPKKRGSLEEQLAALGRALWARGIATTLVLWRRPAPSVEALFAEAGLDVRVMDFQSEWTAAARIARLIAELRPQIVHLHLLRPSSPVALVAAASGARVILNEHMSLHDVHKGIRRVIKRASFRALSPLWFTRVAVSQHVAHTVEAAEAMPWAKLRVIENGVDLQRFQRSFEAGKRSARRALGVDERDRVIACVARMSPEKGVDVAIKALALLDSAPRPVLLVVGDGPDTPACERLASSLGLGGRIHFLGLRDDVEQVLAACDQAWCPSRMEAFGLAAAEAMAAARPVIASRAGGLPEVVEDGVTGILVPPGDEAALAGAADRLFDDPARAEAMGRAGQVRAEERFSMSLFVERVLTLYADADPAFARTASTPSSGLHIVADAARLTH